MQKMNHEEAKKRTDRIEIIANEIMEYFFKKMEAFGKSDPVPSIHEMAAFLCSVKSKVEMTMFSYQKAFNIPELSILDRRMSIVNESHSDQVAIKVREAIKNHSNPH